MSVSDETFFEKFRAFVDKLYPLYKPDYSRDVTNIMNATKYAPERVRAYLATLAELLEQQTKLGDKIDEERFRETSLRFPQQGRKRRRDADAAWQLIGVWDDVVAACGGVEAVAELSQTVVVHYNGEIVRRAG